MTKDAVTKFFEIHLIVENPQASPSVVLALSLHHHNTDTSEQVRNDGYVLGIIEDRNGSLWVGSSNYGLMYHDKNDSTFRQATINLIHEVGNPLEIPVLGCTELT